jgi:COP9 signalosome complex subunit 6
LIASLPATENNAFREEFETEYEDVQLTAFLSSLTKSANILNDVRFSFLVRELRLIVHFSSWTNTLS